MGTSGTCARMARNAAPARNVFNSPSAVRPPSGKTKRGMPARRALTPPLRLASEACGLAVSMAICPERLRYQPMNGSFQSSCLARMRNWKSSAVKITGVSIYEVWLEAKTATGNLRRFSAPRMVSGANEISTQPRAHRCAIWCCTRPERSKSETSSEMLPQSAVQSMNSGPCSRLVRQR